MSGHLMPESTQKNVLATKGMKIQEKIWMKISKLNHGLYK
jgi:hypothetical protein